MLKHNKAGNLINLRFYVALVKYEIYIFSEMHRFNGNSQCLMLSGVFFPENNGLISIPAIKELILLPLVFVKYCQEKRNRGIKKTELPKSSKLEEIPKG